MTELGELMGGRRREPHGRAEEARQRRAQSWQARKAGLPGRRVWSSVSPVSHSLETLLFRSFGWLVFLLVHTILPPISFEIIFFLDTSWKGRLSPGADSLATWTHSPKVNDLLLAPLSPATGIFSS